MRNVSRASILALGLAVAATIPAFAGPASQIKSFFLNVGVQPKAKAKLLMVSNPAQTNLKIAVSGLTPGFYDVVLDGAVVDMLKVGPKGKGAVLHRSLTQPKQGPAVPLPYDPRGSQLAIEQSGTVLLEDEVPESPDDDAETLEIEADLTNLGVIAGESKADFEERFGRMQFEVEMESAPTGLYDLLVDGTKVGEIQVGTGGDGRIEFDSMPSSGSDDDGENDDDGLDLLLTFDPRGKTIAIAQGGVNDFSSVFPLQATGGDDGDDQGEDGGDDGQPGGDDGDGHD